MKRGTPPAMSPPDPKRFKTGVDDRSYAKYGVTRGALSFDDNGKKDVIVIAQGWPSWAFAVEAAGFVLRAVVVLDSEWKGVCMKEFGEHKVISYESFIRDEGDGGKSSVIVSDIDLPIAARLWGRVKEVYIGRRSLRRPKEKPSDFKHLRFDWSHMQSGGVTDGIWAFNFYVSANYEWSCNLIPNTTRQDLSCIINSTVGYGLECPAPAKLTPKQLKVTMLRPHTFHGGGVYPFDNRSAYFVVPSVYTKSKWCRHHLIAEETLGCLDIGEAQMSRLSSEERAKLCKDLKFIPSKVLAQILRGVNHMICSESPATEESVEIPIRRSENPNTVQKGEGSKPGDPLGGGICEGLTIKDPTQLAIERQTRIQKATKADDAEVRVYLWNERIRSPLDETEVKALDTIRRWMHRVWCKLIRVDFEWWFETEHKAKPSAKIMCEEAKRDLEAARDCISRCWRSDWWEWKVGSRPHFWQWPKDYQESIRDGIKLWIKGKVTPWHRPQPFEKDDRLRDGMRLKITVPRQKEYIIKGFVYSLTSFFAVPKGETDIFMVYDGTKSGFNGCCWAPWLMLPTVEQHLRATLPGSFMGDLDISEMFLNFILHEDVQKYCGIDLTKLFPKEVKPGEVLWEMWGRCGMGFTFSPFQAVQGVLWAEEVILGDRYDTNNPFRFEIVKLNLPGMTDYDPSIPWVCKLRMNGDMASKLLIYVDDLRVIVNTVQECWDACSRVAKILNFLGLQDAARKRRGPEQEPGAWSGSVVHTVGDAVSVLISTERWNKLKMIIQ